MLPGPHKQDATPAHNAAAAVLKIAEGDLKAAGILGTTARLGQAGRPISFDVQPFWNVSFEMDADSTGNAMRAVEKFYADMEIDLTARQARIFLLPAVPVAPDWQPQAVGTPHANLLAYSVEPGRIALDLESDRPGFVRLAHPYAASVHVLRDGIPVQAAGDVMSMIVLPIHAGTNAIVVTASPSLLRRASLGITLVTMAAIAALLSLCPVSYTHLTLPTIYSV